MYRKRIFERSNYLSEIMILLLDTSLRIYIYRYRIVSWSIFLGSIFYTSWWPTTPPTNFHKFWKPKWHKKTNKQTLIEKIIIRHVFNDWEHALSTSFGRLWHCWRWKLFPMLGPKVNDDDDDDDDDDDWIDSKRDVVREIA